MTKKYFGTDGIRGKVNQTKINGEMFFKFGLAAGTYFKNQKKTKQTAIIAKDTRLSGYTLEPALVSGLTSAGMHVYTLGPCLLYTSPSPRDATLSRMPSSA